jgi:hypothetical protein
MGGVANHVGRRFSPSGLVVIRQSPLDCRHEFFSGAVYFTSFDHVHCRLHKLVSQRQDRQINEYTLMPFAFSNCLGFTGCSHGADLAALTIASFRFWIARSSLFSKADRQAIIERADALI